MTSLERKLKSALRQFNVAPDATLVVAVSGGADSTALLDALARLRGRGDGLVAAHLNHGLRGAEADADEQFVTELAARLGVQVVTRRADVTGFAQLSQCNLEAAARQLRYEFLREVAAQSGAAAVCTAHTFDDQVETLLMRLLRGTGAEGLRGIHSSVEWAGNCRLLRPLLEVTRAEVLAHCEHYGLTFCVDSSNLSAAFTRNRVRNELLPLLAEFNSRFGATLAQTAARWVEDDTVLQQMAIELLNEAMDGEVLRLAALRAAPAALRRRVLREWLRRQRGDLRRIGSVHLAALESLITRSQSGRVIELPGRQQVVREFDRLRLAPQAPGDLRAGDSEKTLKPR